MASKKISSQHPLLKFSIEPPPVSKKAFAANYSIKVESGAGGGAGNPQSKKKAIALAPEAQ